MIAAIDALRSDRTRFEPRLRAEVRHYLDEQLDPVSWYPVDDLVGLLDALAAFPPLSEMTRRDAFELFGVVAARRDVRSDQGMVPAKQRTTLAGAYEGAIKKGADIATTVRRMLGMWQLYWDEGEHVGERVVPGTLRVRMRGCAPLAPEACWLHTGLYKEGFRLAELAVEVEQTHCTAGGDPECRWTMRFSDAGPDSFRGFPAAL